MNGSWKNLLVCIYVPGNQSIGTGYPVSPDLILTARHVIESVTDGQTLQVRWHHFRAAEDDGWITLSADAVVWRGEDELDAALIRCVPPKEASTAWLAPLQGRKPASQEQWESAGFPHATAVGDRRDPGDFIGLCHTMADMANHFTVSVTTSPKTEEEWKGASGMPVVVNNRILGVATAVPDNFSARQLKVVPAHKLMGRSDFRDKLAYDNDITTFRHEHQQKLVEKIKSYGAAFESVAKELNISVQPELLAEKLLTLPLDRTIPALEKVYRSLSRQQQWPGAKALAEAGELIVPVCHDNILAAHVRRQKEDQTSSLIPLPVHLDTTAEVVMATVGQRATCLRPRLTPEHYPSGKTNLSGPPEAGLDDAVGRAATAVKKHFAAKLGLGTDVDGFIRDINGYVVSRYPTGPAGVPQTSEQQKKAAVRQMKRLVQHGEPEFYMLFRPYDEDAYAMMSQIVDGLKDYPITCLALSGSFEQGEDEKDLFFPLCCLLQQ